jgi:small-conductance mechanosensitive channel
MQIDLGRSVTYPFEDSAWFSKLIVFLIVGFLPGLNLIMWSGYALSVARNLARGEQQPLPAWDAWSDIAVRGLLSLVATALYFAPAALIAIGAWLIGALSNGAESFIMLRLGALGIALLYSLLINYVLTCAHARYAQTDQFYHYLEVGARLRDLRQAAVPFGVLYLYQSLLTFLLLMLTFVVIALFLVALSAAVTNGGILSLIIAPILVLGTAGYIAIVTLGFLTNGYLLGTTLLSVRHRLPSR